MKQNPTFLSLQGSYSTLEISLYNESECQKSFKEDNLRASSLLIPKIKDLLDDNNLSLNDLDFIAVNQGPGAFTSLRVVITVANALAFAKKIPLIGIDGLEALYDQASEKIDSKNIVVILNAYNNDVYFAFKKKGILEKGYKKIDKLILELKEVFEDSIIFVGNAYEQHKDILNNLNHSFIDLQNASASQIAKMALDKWNKNNKDVSYKLTPLYLKSQKFAIKSKK
ncbi:tRNA (adenosine(37)-N6)-threonylcarbamoyltransferase complex dimerization subunit type 1 TsaB [Candidatus Dependentiae bacterium]|nr:tRNA (adenosine(37)-N6)-threonylcarbamoyltransferase complex dimerization subunit type 1 TsaB [Candidatus Dependentiae bacterium]